MLSGQNWRLCHPVNIYVFQNGVASDAPVLVHIPEEKKKNIEIALEAVASRLKLTVGYPTSLYHLNGIKVCRTTELEMYNSYVVATNLDKYFKCADYGCPRGPLVVISGRESKHIRNIRMQMFNKNITSPRTLSSQDRKLRYAAVTYTSPDGFGPTDLPFINSNQDCGTLCQKARCLDCKEDPGLAPNTADARDCGCTQFEDYEGCDHGYINRDRDCAIAPKSEKRRKPRRNKPVEMLDEALDTEDLDLYLNDSNYQLPSEGSEHLLELVHESRDIGGELYNMFNTRMSTVQTDDGSSKTPLLPPNQDVCLNPDALYERFKEKICEDI